VISGEGAASNEIRTGVGPDGKVRVVCVGPTPAETRRQALGDAAFDPVHLALAGVEIGPLAGCSVTRAAYSINI